MSEIKQILIKEHSKAAMFQIEQAILDNPVKINDLINCFFDKDHRLCQRAAGSLYEIGRNHPKWLVPFFPAMIKSLNYPVHDALKRNTLRILEVLPIPDEYTGGVYDLCIHFFSTPNQAVAIRAYSISVSGNIAMKHPDLIPEYLQHLEIIEYDESYAIQSRIKKIRKRINQLGYDSGL